MLTVSIWYGTTESAGHIVENDEHPANKNYFPKFKFKSIYSILSDSVEHCHSLYGSMFGQDPLTKQVFCLLVTAPRQHVPIAGLSVK